MAISFLQKLKKKNVGPPSSEGSQQQEPQQVTQAGHVEKKNDSNAEQLHVDIFQTHSAILIYGQVAGAGVDDFNVLIEGDGDIVTIKGQRIRPNGEVFEDGHDQNVEHILEECGWGRFYRQIILPAEVDSSAAEAKIKNGTLVLRLPLKESSGKGIRINVVEA